MTDEGSGGNCACGRQKAKPRRFHKSGRSSPKKKSGGVGIQGKTAIFECLENSAEQKGAVGRPKQCRIAHLAKLPAGRDAGSIAKENEQNGSTQPQPCAPPGARALRPWVRSDQLLTHAMARTMAVTRPTVGRTLTRRW